MHDQLLGRRSFLAGGALLAAGAILPRCVAAETSEFHPPVAIFSKVYQALKLDFEQSADLTAEAGLDGIDCPVRNGGEIEPERAADELPRYAEILAKRKLMLHLIASGIVNVNSDHARDVLTTARNLGIRYYRIGFIPPDSKIPEVQAQLRELCAMNKEIGITGLLENHSQPEYLGGNLNQMHDVLDGLEPEQIGVAFDVGHALVKHGNDWSTHFERLRSFIHVAYVKDVKLPRKWVPFGEGEVGKTDFFKRLRAMKMTSPMSMHIEFDWTGPTKTKTREAMLATVKSCNQVLRKWLAEA